MAGISQQRLIEMEAEMDRFEAEILSEPSASDLPRVVIGSNTYNQVSSQLKMLRAQTNMSDSERKQRQQEVSSQLKALRAASESQQHSQESSDDDDEGEAYSSGDRNEPPTQKPALDPSLSFLPPPPPPPMLSSTPSSTPSFVPPQLRHRAPPPPPPNRPQGPPSRPQGPGPGGQGPHSGPPGPPRMRPPPPPPHARPPYPGPHMGPGPGPMQGPGPHGPPGHHPGPGGFPGHQSGPGGYPGPQAGPGGYPGHQSGPGGYPPGPHHGMGGMGGPGGPGPGGPMRMPGPPMGGPGGPGPRPGFMQGPRPMGGGPPGPPGDNMYGVSTGEAHTQAAKVMEKVEEDKPKVIYASAPMITVQRDKKGKKRKKKHVDGEEGQGDGTSGDGKGDSKGEPSGPKLPNSLKSYTITMPQPVDNTQVADMELDAGASHPQKEKKEKKKKKFVRMAAGTTWEDVSLAEWDTDDFRLFCGDLGNEVSDEVLARAFNKYPSFVRAKVVRDKRSNKTKGYGFVSFRDPNDYVRAMREMNGKYVGNRPIKLRKSNWKDRNIEVVKKKEREKKKLGLK